MKSAPPFARFAKPWSAETVMISKGFLHNSGRRLAAYFMRGEDGERVQLADLRGFASQDIHEAFRSVDAQALGTNGTKPFFHLSVRNRATDRQLTDSEWLDAADRFEKKLGLTGQARAVVFHVDKRTGERHMHIGWSRIDADNLSLKPLPFFKLRVKSTCRELEQELGLELVGSDRKGEARAAKQWEDQQARRLGTDVRAIREKILLCWQASDCGRSFSAALEENGLLLAKGDRRDYVVLDESGGVHALGKRLLGVPIADVRDRLNDLDLTSLPTVEQAREQQRTGMPDRHAADLAWDDALAAAAIAREERDGRFAGIGRFSPEQLKSLGAVVLDEITRYRATFTRFDVVQALKGEIESAPDREALARAILENPDLVRFKVGGITRYTTKAVVESERHVLDLATALNEHRWHEATAESVAAKTKRLSTEQGRALAHITGPEGLAVLHGQAGTGKTTLLAAGREVYEANGFKVIGLAHQNQVVEGLKQGGFAHANTIDSELWRLAHGRTQWDRLTVLMLDEAAMVDTRRLGMVLAHAEAAGAKVILAGDHKQLPAVERSGLHEVLVRDFGAAVLSEVYRQKESDERQASQLMAQGNFAEALKIYADKGAIHWGEKQSDAIGDLVKKYLEDSAASPDKTRFVFAYTNEAVKQLNCAIRQGRIDRGELADPRSFETTKGEIELAIGDRVQFSATDKLRGIYNGQAGTLRKINGSRLTVELDGQGSSIEFDSRHFQGFRHGYASTVYAGQGRTIDETYALHTKHLRDTASYVVLTRHSLKTDLFVPQETARTMGDLVRQMARPDDRRAASYFLASPTGDKEKPLSPLQLAAWYANLDNHSRSVRAERTIPGAERTSTRDLRPNAKASPENHATRPLRMSNGMVGGMRGAFSQVSTILSTVSALFGQDQPAPPQSAAEAEARRIAAEEAIAAQAEVLKKKRRYQEEMETQRREGRSRER
jgi:hypothetical protein